MSNNKENKSLGLVEDFFNKAKGMTDAKDIAELSKDFNEKMFLNIQKMTQSGDMKLDEAIASVVGQLKEELGKVCEKEGIAIGDLEHIVNDPANFSTDQWANLQNLKKELGVKGDFSLNKKPLKKRKLKRNRKNWQTV